MSITLKLSLVLFSIILITIITVLLSKDKIFIKYSFSWFFIALIILIVAIFPRILTWVQNIIGFESMVHMVIAIIFALLIYVIISLTVIISEQRKKITLLIQKVSTIESKINKNN